MPVILQAAIAAPAPDPDSGILVCGSPRGDNAATGVAALDPLPDLGRLVRVVDADVGAVGAEVDHVVALERLRDGVAKVDTTVVEGDGDPHGGEPTASS